MSRPPSSRNSSRPVARIKPSQERDAHKFSPRIMVAGAGEGREAHSGGRQRAVARDMAARPLSLIPLLLPAPRDRGTRERRDEIG